MVEFALILPVMLVFVLGLIEIGRAFVFGVAVQDGAREAARLAANGRLNPALTDAAVLQRLVDGSSPAMLGCSVLSSTSTSPVTMTCGGGTWTLSMRVTPNGSSTSYPSLSALPSSARAQLNGGTVEVKAVGSVSLLAGFATGWANMALQQIRVQGDAVMVVL